jgi:hypothetical protein
MSFYEHDDLQSVSPQEEGAGQGVQPQRYMQDPGPPDPTVSIPWNEVRAGYWEARCVCGVEGWHAPDAGRVRRNDPYDPATARHLGQCEFVGETDAAIFGSY